MSSQETNQPPPEDDPFNDEDSELLLSIDLGEPTPNKSDGLCPPPPKRLKQSEANDDNQLVPEIRVSPTPGTSREAQHEIIDLTENDPFSCDSDDEQMYKIADALEKRECSETWRKVILGPPHPLLIPHIYEKILSHVTTPSTLLSARRVCTSWNDVVQDRTFKVATLRNISHVIERYPYGLAYVEENETYMPPCPLPILERIHIADTCFTIMKPEVGEYFRAYGGHIKYIGYDANLYCKEHWIFVRRVLDDWCTNLEELELVGVTCTDSLLSYSELRQAKKYKLKKLTVKCNEAPIRDHHHGSTVNMMRFNNRFYVINRFECRRDGGLLSRILINSPNLDQLTLHFSFTPLSGYLAHMRLFRVNFSNLKILELVGVGGFGIDTGDIRVLRTCNLHLTSLSIGPLNTNINGNVVTGFLQSQAPTLEHLQLLGSRPQTQDTRRLSVVRFTFPELPLLKSLEIRSATRYRTGNFEYIYRAPGLNTLKIETDPVPLTYKHNAELSINRMFIERDIEHPSLRSFSFTGPYTNTHDHVLSARMLTSVAQNLDTLSVTCTSSNVLKCVEAYSNLKYLTTMSVHVTDQSFCNPRDLLSIFNHQYESLRTLNLTANGTLALRLDHARLIRRLYTLTLDGFLVHDNEANSVAKTLSEKINYTNFKNCRLVKPGTATVFGYVGKKSKPIPETSLTLVNLPLMTADVFHVI